MKLMPEYECHPIWDGVPSANIAASELEISLELRERLNRWNGRFQSTYNRSDPKSSGFCEIADALAFNEEGKVLADCIAVELGLAVDFIPVQVEEAEQSGEPEPPIARDLKS